MSDYTDFVEACCRSPFTEYAEAQLELDELRQWKQKYESHRDKYPPWVTKAGEQIKVKDLTDSHIEALIDFIPTKDPKNETKWIDVIKSEKQYRTIDAKIFRLEEEVRQLSNEINSYE